MITLNLKSFDDNTSKMKKQSVLSQHAKHKHNEKLVKHQSLIIQCNLDIIKEQNNLIELLKKQKYMFLDAIQSQPLQVRKDILKKINPKK